MLIPVSFSLTANTNQEKTLGLSQRVRLVGAKICDSTGIAADNTDYRQFEVKNGSTLLLDWDTRVAHEGALTADVSASMATHNAGASLEFAPGDEVIVKSTYAGSGKAVESMIMLEFEPSRQF
jgi:hypothetical protein